MDGEMIEVYVNVLRHDGGWSRTLTSYAVLPRRGDIVNVGGGRYTVKRCQFGEAIRYDSGHWSAGDIDLFCY